MTTPGAPYAWRSTSGPAAPLVPYTLHLCYRPFGSLPVSFSRRILSLLLLVAGLGVINPAAHAAGTGSVSSSGGVLYSDCRQHDYTYSLSLPAGTTYWNLDVTVLGPDGLESAGDYLYDSADPATGVADFQVCGGQLAGRYTITSTLTTSDADFNESTTALPNATFTMRLPFTRTTLATSDRTPTFGQSVRFKIRTRDERVNGYFSTDYARVRLEARRDGGWVVVRGSRTYANSDGVARVTFRWKVRGTEKLRAVTKGNDYYASSRSSILRMS